MLFTTPTLSSDGLIISPEKYNPTHDKELGVWSLDQFSRTWWPVLIGDVPNREEFDNTNIRVLDMPIKMAGSDEYRVPIELKQFIPTIKACIEHEHNTNPYIDEYYAYITVDSGVVMKGTTQRNEGYHVDGFQGARITKKTLTNRSYIASNKLPTVFNIQPFNVSKLDERKHNFFHEFDRQANKKREWRTAPYEIAMMDAYCVHKADIAPETMYRVFFRLSFDVKIFDRKGNTHNPMFDYNWIMVERDVKKTLIDYHV